MKNTFQTAPDGTTKFLITLDDGAVIESVLIPHTRTTSLCISSQAGCPLKCTFCATGAQGFTRNLTHEEIMYQIKVAWDYMAPHHPDSIVFMGMGEPLLNYDNVLKTIHELNNPHTYNFSQSKITVSTVGIPDKIIQLGKDCRAKLALSLHATDDKTRSQLIPLNKKYPIRQIIEACKQFPAHRRRQIMIAYTFFENVNDDLTNADKLNSLFEGIPILVNLIPYNPHKYSQYTQSPLEKIEAFKNRLISLGIKTFIRETRGYKIDAACGMLAGKKEMISCQ